MLGDVTGVRCASCGRRRPLDGGRCDPCWSAAVAGDEAARAAAARAPGAPAPVVAALAGDRSPLVRAEVAARPDLPEHLIARLADPRTEGDATVLRRMAAHARLGARAGALAATGDVVVLRRLAANPGVPAEALADLAGHPDPAVRRPARGRLAGARLTPAGRARLPVGLRRLLGQPRGP
jgi:hypothetical protein